jgi:hypothetical protein
VQRLQNPWPCHEVIAWILRLRPKSLSHKLIAMSDSDADLAAQVATGVERTLTLARTWLRWDGTPLVSEDEERVYTPHKSLRRYADHLIDHLAQIEALTTNATSLPDRWHGSLVTLAVDWAPFTEADLQEANERLRRLAEIYRLRLRALGPTEWDRPRGEAWTIREIVQHVAPPWYAEQVGDLST